MKRGEINIPQERIDIIEQMLLNGFTKSKISKKTKTTWKLVAKIENRLYKMDLI